MLIFLFNDHGGPHWPLSLLFTILKMEKLSHRQSHNFPKVEQLRKGKLGFELAPALSPHAIL